MLSFKNAPLETGTPRETKTVAVVAVFLTIFCLLPVIVVLLFKNRSLTEENATLRHELGMKMQQIEKLSSVEAVAAKGASTDKAEDESVDFLSASALNAGAGIDDAEDETLFGDDDADNAAASRPESDEELLPRTPPEAAVKAAAISAEESEAIRRDITLMPNGMRLSGKGASASLTVDPLAGIIAQAFSFVSCGQRSDAAISFGKIVEYKPYWPYGYFYLGLLSGDKKAMAKAADLFEKAELIGASTPESIFYEALTALYRKANFSAEGYVSRLSVRKTGHDPLQTGPALYPPDAPAKILESLKKIPGAPELVRFTPDWNSK